MTVFRLIAIASVLAVCSHAGGQPPVAFYDSFEQAIGINWSLWQDVTVPPGCCGPEMLFNEGSHAHAGSLAARQEQAQPWWYGSVHNEPGLANELDETITLSAWQFEDADRLAPQHTSHDQVQGWIALMNQAETEFFAIGVHAHYKSPPPLLDWWQHVSWSTAANGWHTTTFLRAQGWRHLKIVLHPYSGNVGDVEFYIDDVKVGEGSRLPGSGGKGVAVTRIGLGSSPAHVPEDYISNTYEFFWYDELGLNTEVPLLPCPNPVLRFDADADRDLDQDDFGAFQRCYDYEVPFDPATCACMNADGNEYINGDDFDAFQACAAGSGPGIRADASCDDAMPFP